MITRYLNAIWRWMWLILLAPLVAAAIVYAVGTTQSPIYEASVRLVVGPGIEAVNPDLNDMRAAAQLMWTYSEFATSAGLLNQLIDQYQLPMDLEDLRSQITVSPDQTTLWLTIRVRSTNGAQAVVISNALAEALLAMSPSSSATGEDQVKASVTEQIRQVEQELEVTEAQIRALQAQWDAATTTTAQRSFEARISEQQSHLFDSRTLLLSLYSLFQETYTNQLTIVESPTDATVVDSQIPILIILAAVAGLIAALAIVLAFESFQPATDAPGAKSAAPTGKAPTAGGVHPNLSPKPKTGNQQSVTSSRNPAI